MALPTVTRISSGAGNSVTMSANANAWHVVFIDAALNTYPSSVTYTDPTGFTRYRQVFGTGYTNTGAIYAGYGINHSNNLTFTISTNRITTYGYHYYWVENAAYNDSAITNLSNTSAQSISILNNSTTAAQLICFFVAATYPPSGWVSYCSGITPAPHEYNYALNNSTWCTAWDSSTATSTLCSRSTSSARVGWGGGFTFEYQAPLKRDGVTNIAAVDAVTSIASVDGA